MASQIDIELEEATAQRRMSKAIFFRLAAYLRPYRRIFAFNLVFTLLATVSQLLGPKFIQIGIDRYLTNFSSAQAAYQGILLVSIIYLGNLLLGWFLSVAQVKSAIRVGQGAMNDLRLAVFEHIQKLSLNYFDKTHQGRTTFVIAQRLSTVQHADQILVLKEGRLVERGRHQELLERSDFYREVFRQQIKS